MQFREAEDGEIDSMPYASKVAVWPFGQGEVIFADRLEESGRYSVTTPGTVSTWLRDQGLSEDTSMLTSSEERAAFEGVCRAYGVGQVHSAVSRGVSSDTKIWSLKRGAVTYRADLRTYSCSNSGIVWEDELALVVEVGSTQPSEVELFEIAAEAWAERVIELQRGSGDDSAVAPSSPVATGASYDKQLVSDIQEELAARGHYSGAVDGLYGPNTKRAIQSYQAEAGLEESGKPSKLLLRYIQTDDEG